MKVEFYVRVSGKANFQVTKLKLSTGAVSVTVISEEATQTSPSEFTPRSKPFRRFTRVAGKFLPTDVPLNASSLTIWIDPLDATKEYIEGLTQYTTVMIGIAVDGTPVAGIIHKPFLVETVVGVNLPGFSKSVRIVGQKAPNRKTPPYKIMHSRSHVTLDAVKSAFKAVCEIPVVYRTPTQTNVRIGRRFYTGWEYTPAGALGLVCPSSYSCCQWRCFARPTTQRNRLQ
ncbi:Oidioi.mRNA.OKI2018_I69.XSR.g15482.t1.cds [Oikopleura dioica]|uniref:inositol-phosphate phosphatase n=1 Tax=Oikopleura dioica TaxID=34765 RepID=A0ABN7SI44_OIKDI|nr:Oidioi.mRNA.OKI2018_I69.XSR.g15482.t1.cds [Oikopleura dioica]